MLSSFSSSRSQITVLPGMLSPFSPNMLLSPWELPCSSSPDFLIYKSLLCNDTITQQICPKWKKLFFLLALLSHKEAQFILQRAKGSFFQFISGSREYVTEKEKKSEGTTACKRHYLIDLCTTNSDFLIIRRIHVFILNKNKG